eukprot:7710750-Lingulodinium_polyedra.AAC.1
MSASSQFARVRAFAGAAGVLNPTRGQPRFESPQVIQGWLSLLPTRTVAVRGPRHVEFHDGVGR